MAPLRTRTRVDRTTAPVRRDGQGSTAQDPSAARRSVTLYFALAGGLNLVAWGALLLWVAPAHPTMLGLGVLAYAFGLRHAFDADHISAIDNTVRKLLHGEHRKPVGVGFHFSLGHSTVVALLVLALAIAAQQVRTHLPGFQHVGNMAGTLVSGGFLYLIALMNLVVLLDMITVFRRMRGGTCDGTEIEAQLLRRGLMTRLLGSRWDLVRHERHMYPVGFLFGLGFDTQTEVALLAMASATAVQHTPIATVMVLPLLFAAGMCLMDTADGAFMSTAYAWAFSNPLRKVYYNLTVTGLSVFAALAVGTVEFVQVAAGELRLTGPLWTGLQSLNFENLGLVIAAVFVLTWATSYLFWVWYVAPRWSNAVSR